ncbi:MerR family transcriptional regulator [Maritimibacter sp. 55A14]|uniref:MerR family transcriptional regulator n=1 Tax=Maritimibacter sp. 55A14 TaxID=2174844 RepID=UPI000D6216CE|nr:MerR family transcriptional regulator [Maritimibacter sp. 55A14]PWE33968.1 MerR family transcriptional regulator [Maritimibacter sp. 55A14]
MKKSPEAFRTISEVAEWLETPAHVLRFWESRFSQVKPVKRAGGRRYYRPSDMRLLGGIKTLLHDDGVTIRGVQKILREQGVKHVAGLSPPVTVGEASTPEAANRPAPATGRTPSRRARPEPAPDAEAVAPGDGIPAPTTEPAPREPHTTPVTPLHEPGPDPAAPSETAAADLPPTAPVARELTVAVASVEALNPRMRNQVALLCDRLEALRDRMSEPPASE